MSLQSVQENIEEWASLHASGRFEKLFSDKATRGELKRSALRGVLWKWRLTPLKGSSVSDWVTQLNDARANYAKLKKRYLVDPHSNPSYDPLSQSEESPWNDYFENAGLEKEIEQDIKRTFPEVEFFRGEWVRKAMLDILLIYAREEPHIGYKQGMHELLAPILYVLKRVSLTAADAATINGAAAASGGKFASFAPLLDAEHVESDAYAAFRGLMTHTQDWFVSPARKRTTSSSLSLSSSTAGSASNAPLSMQDEAQNSAVLKCQHIQSTLLRSKDPELSAYLDSLNIAPQLYALRWLRCLFSREFHIEDTLKLWDALFGYGGGPPLLLVDYVACAMLRYVRLQLLAADYTAALTRLKTFPPVEDVSYIVDLAVALHSGPAPSLVSSSSASNVVASANSSSSIIITSITSSSPALSATPLSSSVAPPLTATSSSLSARNARGQSMPTTTSATNESARNPTEIAHYMATEIATNPAVASSETLLLLLAELKQIRDIVTLNE